MSGGGSSADARPGLHRRGWSWLQGRLQGREDSEHEQTLVRLAIASGVLAYLAIASLAGGPLAEAATRLLSLGAGYQAGAALLFVHLLHAPAANPPRRLFGLLLDMATLTFALLQGGAAGAVFYPFYLWIIFGMGFRYGRGYLMISVLLGLSSFACVIALIPYWQQQPALAGGLWAALIALPLYAGKLLRRLTEALEHAEAASRAKSRFLATISHELRTPLHAVLASTELLRSTSLDHEQRALVRTAETSGRGLLTMIDDLLDVAAIGEARVSEPERFDLHQLFATVTDLVRLQAVAKGLAFRVRLDPAIPYRVRGSRRALHQILQNLLANAVKFTSRGSVALRAHVIRLEPAEVSLRIEIADTGIGIPEDAQARIFERFRQADESTTRRFGGTGLGLAIARQLAETIDAHLTVESIAGVGATFFLDVPLAVEAGEPSGLRGEVLLLAPSAQFEAWRARVEALGADCRSVRAPSEPGDGAPHALLVVGADVGRAMLATAPLVLIAAPDEEVGHEAMAVLPYDCSDALLHNALHAAFARPPQAAAAAGLEDAPARRILVAEDNRINRQVIERILARGGHDVTLVENGEDALDALEREAFDLVLMDLNMPVMDGIEAVKMHRVMCPKEQAPVFAALTADVTEATRRACHEAGIDVVVTKPVEPARLLSMIAQLTADTAGGARGTVRTAAPGRSRPEPAAGEVAVFEPAQLHKLRDLDDDGSFLPMVLREFIDDAHTLAGELEGAARAVDSAAFRDRAHALRSSAAYVGATALFDLCGSWRGIGPDELAARGPHHMARLRTELHRLETAFASELPKIAGYASPEAGPGD